MVGRLATLLGLLVVGSLLYVGQQIEVVKLGYDIQVQEQLLSELLDHNRLLLYNAALLESPEVLKARADALHLGLGWSGVPRTALVRAPRSPGRHPRMHQLYAAWRMLRDWVTIERAAVADTPTRKGHYPLY